jgi:hypothetical protein
VIVDFGAFDAWYEEDQLNVAHPRDPFHEPLREAAEVTDRVAFFNERVTLSR